MRRPLAVFATLLLLGCSQKPAAEARAQEPIVGLPCEGCEAVFQGLPETLAASARIAPESEPGEPLRIEGTVTHAKGRPAPGVIVYAYHTDSKGIYPTDSSVSRLGEAAARHGRLRGWVKTDEKGRYRFDTIRPAGYPDSDLPQHVHMHVIEPGRCTYYIDDLMFDDDPRLTPKMRQNLVLDRGGPGVVMPVRTGEGGWLAVRDIGLGAKIPGYPG